jgi:hypothetical protein
MRTLTAQQTAIIAAENYTEKSWLFEIDRTGNGIADDYWSTKDKAWDNGLTWNYNNDFNAGWVAGEFNNWVKPTITSDSVVAPDGETTADTIVRSHANASSDGARISVVAGQTYTASVWLKAGTETVANIWFSTGLNNALVGQKVVELNIDLTAGWVKYSVTYTVPSSGVNQIEFNVGFLSGTVGLGYYAWGAKIEHNYTFAIMDFSPPRMERNRSEYGISAPPLFNFTVTNKATTLYPSDFAGGNVTLRRVIKAWVRMATVTVTGGTKPVAGETMTGVTSGKTAVVLGPPDTWAGAVSVYFVSQSGAFQAENVSFTGGGTGTIAADLTYAEEEAEESVWNFDFVSVAPEYQTLRFECQSWIEKYLNGVYPNTQTLDSLWPSDQNDYTGCVPLIFGTCYIPLHTALISQDRYYVLGPAGPEYTITKSRSPMEIDTVTEWLPAGYAFTQSDKAGADGNNYRVFQLFGTETVSEDPSNVLYKLWNNVFGGLSETVTRTVNVGASYLALPTKFARNDTTITTPTGVIHYILEDFGIPTGRIDDPSRVIAAATIAGWGLTWNTGIYNQEDRKTLLAKLCTECHLELIIRDKVYFKVHAKASQRTVTATDIIENSFSYRVNKKELSNCGYASYPDPSGNVPVSKLTRTLVPAVTGVTTQKSNVEVDCAFVSSGSVHAQILAQLTLQRKLLPEADISFNAKGFLLALEPDDIITMSGANYGAGAGHTYAVLIDSMSVSKDLEVSITGTRFSADLKDFADLAPSAAVVGVDGVAGIYKVVVCGPEAPGQAPADDPTIFGGVIKASTNVGMSGLVSGGVDWRIWAGASFANRATAPFRVDDDGNLWATSGHFAGIVTGSYIYGSSLMTKGTYLAASCLAADATLTVGDTTDFPASGSASFIDSANDRDVFTYTGKTATTLTGCSGVLAHTVSASNKPLVVPAVRGIYISDAVNEMRFFGDRGDGTIEELAGIGIIPKGGDNVVAKFGSLSSIGKYGVYGLSGNAPGVIGESVDSWGVYGTSHSGVGGGFYSVHENAVYGESLDVDGVHGASTNGYGAYGYSLNSYSVYSAGTTYLGGNTTILDAKWIGLASNKGRIQFDDEAVDTIKILDCHTQFAGGGVTIGDSGTDPGLHNLMVDGTLHVDGVATFDAGIVLNGNNQINTSSYNGTDGLVMNYTGYNGGTTQFRDFRIYDGKSAAVALFTGTDKGLTLYGPLHVDGVATLDGGAVTYTANDTAGAGYRYCKVPNA